MSAPSLSVFLSQLSRGAALARSRNWVLLLPSFVLFAFVLAIVILLWVLYWHDREVARVQVQKDLQWTAESIRRGIASDQEFIERMAQAVAVDGEMSAATAREATEALSESYSMLNITWNALNGESLWGVASGRTMSQTLQERPNTVELGRVLRLSQAMGRSTYTVPYQDLHNVTYIEFHAPILRNGNSLGTLSATFSLSGILEAYVPNQYAERYQFGFFDGTNRELFSQRPRTRLSDFFSESVSLTMPWRDLKLQAKAYHSDTPLARDGLAVITLVLLAILTWALWLLQRYINRRVESDAMMHERYERFLTVLDALDAAVYVAGLDDDRLLFMNDAGRKRFPDAKLGGHVGQLEQVFTASPSLTFGSRQLLGPEGPASAAAKGEFEDRTNGHWYLVRAKAIRWVDGRLVRMHMASDITDRKQAEEASRVQKERLMQTARLMTAGEMASTLAHEINQPLAAIANYNMGCVKRLRSGQWNAEELLAAMEKAAQQAERAGRVVSRMREFVRTREPNRQAQNLNEIILDVIRLSGLDGEAATVALRLTLDPNLPTVLADRIMIEQVILNLVKNAIEAMQQTPPELRVLDITSALVTGETGMVEVCVTDAGHGVDQAVELELFSPFFTTKRNGMGIGLNICRSIIELHEGHLTYHRPEAGAGSMFRFTLPLYARDGLVDE
jgi:C4-dicarboxylate-specific signal transduction histidine kinase